MTPNVKLSDFLSGTKPDGEGRLLGEILNWPDVRLEQVHDFIQWLFPLPEPSPVNPSAPLLDVTAIATIRARPDLQFNLRRSYQRMRRFYENWRHWIVPGNHNHLRITRILKCLMLTGLEPEALDFFTWLTSIYEAGLGKPHPGISERSYAFWKEAVKPVTFP